MGDSYQTRTASNFGQNANIAITSTVVGITYIEFLAQSESKPFVVGRTEIISTTNRQCDIPVTVTHRDADGHRKDFVVGQNVDPYQWQVGRVVDDTEYVMDGLTRILFRQILASTTATLRIYPVEEFNAFEFIQKLKGQQHAR